VGYLRFVRTAAGTIHPLKSLFDGLHARAIVQAGRALANSAARGSGR
jgi:hypothetical protein